MLSIGNRGKSKYEQNRGRCGPSNGPRHGENPSIDKREYTHGMSGLITFAERYRVNTGRIMAGDTSVCPTMTKKLTKTFMKNACDNAMRKEMEKRFQNGTTEIERKMRGMSEQATKETGGGGLRNLKMRKLSEEREEKLQSLNSGEIETVESPPPKEKAHGQAPAQPPQPVAKEATASYLIKYVMENIKKEERMNLGTSGTKRMLSFKEKLHLLTKFLDLRANPHKNRMY